MVNKQGTSNKAERTRSEQQKTAKKLIKQVDAIDRHTPIAVQYRQAMLIKDDLAALPEASDRYNFAVQHAIQTIRAIEGEYGLRTALGTIDKETLQNDRLTYGAKGANLIALSKFLAKFAQTKFSRIARHIEIPAFELVPASLYIDWKKGKDITPTLRGVFARVKQWGGSIAVRSSAVYAEDGEETTGAGIYNSIFTSRYKDATCEDFEAAVYAVYASCESPRAQEYRAENGVAEEEAMGLVIQKTIEDGQKGYGNSTHPYTQTLMDIHIERDGKNAAVFPYKKEKVINRICAQKSMLMFFREDRYIELDDKIWETSTNAMIEALAIPLMTALEWYYGHPVQIEYIAGIDDTVSLQVVQVRPLPVKMFTGRKVEFPNNTDYIAEFDALGCCDEVLPILDEWDVSQKEGIVIKHSSGKGWDSGRHVPKKGVVIFPARSAECCGHLETLAMEKGLVIVYCESNENIENQTAYTRLSIAIAQARNAQAKATKGADQRAFLRVVANGEKVRFYHIPQQTDTTSQH